MIPVLCAFGIFSGIQLFRKLTKLEYTPSYFAVFPLSMLERQLAEYFGEDRFGMYQSIKNGGRKKNTRLYIKAWISIFLTFLMVPLITGFLVAFILTPQEFAGFLLLLVGIEFIRCGKATYDFANYRDNWNSAILFFVAFYLTYLGFLWFVFRLSYHFAFPFIEKSDYSGLFSTLESLLVPFLIGVFVLGVATNLLAHYLVNKDSLMPSWSGYYEADDEKEENGTGE